MARQKRLKVAAVNITTEPPHCGTRYIELFKAVANKDPSFNAPLGGSDYLMIDSVVEMQYPLDILMSAKPEGTLLCGNLIRFTRIDPKLPWGKRSTKTVILDDEGKPIPQVDEDLCPNWRSISFIFDVERHLLVYDTRNIAPNLFSKGIAGLFADVDIVSAFGPITTVTIPTIDALSTLMKLPQKRSVIMDFSLPNGDVPDEMEESIKRRYQKRNVSRIKMEEVAQIDKEIVPDDEMEATMRVASLNGYVSVVHVDKSGAVQTKSTREMPRIESDMYGEKEYWQVFKKLAKIFAASIRGKAE